MPPTYKTLLQKTVTKEKQIITHKVVEFCARDVRPYEIITGQGFLNLVQYFVSIGAKYGEIDVKTVLPHPTTVSRHVSDVRDEMQAKVLPIIEEAINKGECAATTDGWSDNYKKKYYLSMTTHFFDDDFCLHKKNLFISIFPKKRKTGANIKNEMVKRFESLGFDKSELHKIPFVTDQGGNCVKAFEGDYHRENCCCHLIQTVLRNTFEKHAPVRIEILLDNCKQITRYLKQSEKHSSLKYTVKQEAETRWNSKLGMVAAINKQYPQIMKLLTPEQEKEWCFDQNLAAELIRFLEIFKEASDELEGDKYPTSNKILVWRNEILKHIKNGNFVGEMKTIANFAEIYMNSKFPLLMEHKVACFLDPRYRCLNMLSEAERNEVIEEVYELLKMIPDPIFESSPDDGPPAKRLRFMCYEEENTDINSYEIQSYIQTADYSNIKDKKHLVETFWRKNKSNFPKLYLLARKRLCVPASSASSERMFKEAGRTFNTLRTNLKPEALDDLLFVKDNFVKVS